MGISLPVSACLTVGGQQPLRGMAHFQDFSLSKSCKFGKGGGVAASSCHLCIDQQAEAAPIIRHHRLQPLLLFVGGALQIQEHRAVLKDAHCC